MPLFPLFYGLLFLKPQEYFFQISCVQLLRTVPQWRNMSSSQYPVWLIDSAHCRCTCRLSRFQLFRQSDDEHPYTHTLDCVCEVPTTRFARYGIALLQSTSILRQQRGNATPSLKMYTDSHSHQKNLRSISYNTHQH